MAKRRPRFGKKFLELERELNEKAAKGLLPIVDWRTFRLAQILQSGAMSADALLKGQGYV